MTKEELIRKVKLDNKMNIFLGAGASISSQVPSANSMVWKFKRDIYCSEQNISIDKFENLDFENNKYIIQDYFDKKQKYPKLNDPNEYSFYFEKCFPNSFDRQKFIENEVLTNEPSLGYLQLAVMIINKKINNIFTTNFDQLVKHSINKVSYNTIINEISSINSNCSIPSNDYQSIIQMHGDFRYDKLKNTKDELQSLEKNIEIYSYSKLINSSLVVIGYSGNDESIMSFFEEHIKDGLFLNRGLYWCIIKNTSPNSRVQHIINEMNKYNKKSEIIEIDGFDELMDNFYKNLGLHNDIIEDKINDIYSCNKISFNANRIDNTIKFNAYQNLHLPECISFESSISSQEVREISKKENIIACKYQNRIYSFETIENLQSIFGNKINDSIKLNDIPRNVLRNENSFYIGMIYLFIKLSLKKCGINSYKRNCYYIKNTKQISRDKRKFQAFKIKIEYIKNNFILLVIPTFHYLNMDYTEINQLSYKITLNSDFAQLYNSEYDTYILKLQSFLMSNNKIEFSYKNQKLIFDSQRLETSNNLLNAYKFNEPIMQFDINDLSKSTINQQKGLIQYGPFDYSYNHSNKDIKLTIFSPIEYKESIYHHLNKLNKQVKNGKDQYTSEYNGFKSIYRANLILSDIKDKTFDYSEKSFSNKKRNFNEFYEFLKRGIDKFSTDCIDSDVLVIFISEKLKCLKEDGSVDKDFDLHDAIKLYAASKYVVVQFIEERSLNQQDERQVMWALSSAIYTKANGILWRPKTYPLTTAFISLSYAISSENICIGLMQLFDTNGTGIKMYAKEIKNPIYLTNTKKNPYMSRDEMREIVNNLIEIYTKNRPLEQLQRIVVYKTTPFMSEEIKGIKEATFSVEDIELIQVQEYNGWKGIKYNKYGKENFPVDRGTAVILDDDRFLLWTNGNVRNDEIYERNYYKSKRCIPYPLYIKKFYGTYSNDILVEEIMMLTKMNWNSGESLYKTLPVPIDFSKTIARMSKQKNMISNMNFDFRYFM